MQQRDVKFDQVLKDLIERGYHGDRKKLLRSANVTSTALSQFVHGRSGPSFDILVSLANFFEVSLDYLVFGEPTPSSPDHGALLRYLEVTLAEAQAQVRRETDLVTRMGRVIVDRIKSVAQELAQSNTAGRDGLNSAG